MTCTLYPDRLQLDKIVINVSRLCIASPIVYQFGNAAVKAVNDTELTVKGTIDIKTAYKGRFDNLSFQTYP